MTKPNTLRIDDVEYVRADSVSAKNAVGPKGPLTLVRTYSAGVHIGELISQVGTVVVLANARRIYTWTSTGLKNKSYTCNEIAKQGVGSGSKISDIVSQVTLTEAIELLPVTEQAAISLMPKWG